MPSWSASFPGVQQLAVGGDHGDLYKSPDVLRVLGSLLGKQGVLSSATAPDRIRISIRDDVVAAGAKEPVVLFMNRPTGKLNVQLIVRKVTGRDGRPLVTPEEICSANVSYEGAPIESLSLSMQAPDYPGVYEFDLLGSAGSVAENSPTLLVQAE